MITEDDEQLAEYNSSFVDLAAQDPRCYYQMVDAMVRRHGRRGDLKALTADMGNVVHPSHGIVPGILGDISSSTGCEGTSLEKHAINENVRAGTPLAAYNSHTITPTSSSRSSKGNGTNSANLNSSSTDPSNSSSMPACTSTTSSSRHQAVLSKWKSTQAFLSALLSYRKGMMLLLPGPRPLGMSQELANGLFNLLQWFHHEGVLDRLHEPLALKVTGNRSGCPAAATGPAAAAAPAGLAAAPATGHVAAATARMRAGGPKPLKCSPAKGPNQPTADPDEVAACRMLTLGVLARVLLTYCQLLPFPSCSTGQGEHHHSSSSSSSSRGGDVHDGSSSKRGLGNGSSSRGSKQRNSSSYGGLGNGSSSDGGFGNSSSSKGELGGGSVPGILENLRASSLSAADVPWLMHAGLLGVVCYCLLKQLMQDSTVSSGGPGGAGGSSNSSSCDLGSSSSRGRDDCCREGVGGRSAAAAAQPKWGGMQRELPASLVQALQTFESVIQGLLQQEWAWAGTMYSHRMWQESGEDICGVLFAKRKAGWVSKGCKIRGEGVKFCSPVTESGTHLLRWRHQDQEEEQQWEQPDQSVVRQMVELLGQLLVLCEEVVHTVQIPLGCNNPNCTNLEGMSEAAAAKVCTGCHRVHYCSFECIKAHWKEHMPLCK